MTQPHSLALTLLERVNAVLLTHGGRWISFPILIYSKCLTGEETTGKGSQTGACIWLIGRPPQVVPECCLRTQGSPLLHTNSYSSSGSPSLRCWCTVWRQGGVYFLLLIVLMMLILLCFKCHCFVSCSISKVSQFISACSAKSPSQGLCIFPIVISSLARAPGTVSSSFTWTHHWVFHSPLSFILFHCSKFKLLVLPFKALHNSILPHTSPGICYPSTNPHFVDCSLHFCFLILHFPLWLGRKSCSETSNVLAVDSFTTSLSRIT